jgi:MFS family permease
MCGFSFTVFVSLFILLPTMPYRILALGGRARVAGFFLGLLTYTCAISAPITGAYVDRVGKRRVLIGASLAIFGFSVAYALSPSWQLPVALACIHGIFWSALMTASAAYLTDGLPPQRRAEGIAWWGSASIVAIALAPPIGFRLQATGWTAVCAAVAALNLAQAAVAWGLPKDDPRPRAGTGPLVEWHVMGIAVTMFLYTFGYGAVTSFVALRTDALHVTPRSLFFIVFAAIVLATRPFSGPLGDRVGYRRVLLPALALASAGLALLAFASGRASLALAAVVFGLGYGTVYPMFTAHVIRHVHPSRRGAAFGSMLAAFDTGVGSGSIVAGWIVERHGFTAAFTVAAALAALAVPYFAFTDRRWLRDEHIAAAGAV